MFINRLHTGIQNIHTFGKSRRTWIDFDRILEPDIDGFKINNMCNCFSIIILTGCIQVKHGMIKLCTNEWFTTGFIQDLHGMREHVLIVRNYCTWTFPAGIMFHNKEIWVFLKFRWLHLRNKTINSKPCSFHVKFYSSKYLYLFCDKKYFRLNFTWSWT